MKLATQKNKWLIHERTWINLTSIMQSKRSLTQKSIYCMISLTWCQKIRNESTVEKLQNRGCRWGLEEGFTRKGSEKTFCVLCLDSLYVYIRLPKCSECSLKMVHFTVNVTSKEKCQQIFNSDANDMPLKYLGEVHWCLRFTLKYITNTKMGVFMGLIAKYQGKSGKVLIVESRCWVCGCSL